jgi:ABC-type proline/glycine betaine transport system ATPase subunit
MNGGRIEQVGAPIDILSRPATPFVAELFAPDEMIAQLRSEARRP